MARWRCAFPVLFVSCLDGGNAETNDNFYEQHISPFAQEGFYARCCTKTRARSEQCWRKSQITVVGQRVFLPLWAQVSEEYLKILHVSVRASWDIDVFICAHVAESPWWSFNSLICLIAASHLFFFLLLFPSFIKLARSLARSFLVIVG